MRSGPLEVFPAGAPTSHSSWECVVALGETELAAGRPAQAAHHLALVRAEQALLRGNGVNTDTELALF